MGRVSILVDAGYLFAQGSRAVLKDRRGRHEVALDAHAFVTKLVEWVRGHYPADEILRTYWYDGARRGIPDNDQLNVAALPYVKLRLGRMTAAGEQKGVDTLIVRDLMVLSQERSIQRAIVLSGDEDLREGIAYAQDRGVHVTVVGIEAQGDREQSIELVREADESLVLPHALLDAVIGRRAPVWEAAGEAEPTVEMAREATTSSPTGADVSTLAQQFARDWIAKSTPAELAALLAARPVITPELDAALLQYVSQQSGVFRIGEAERRAVREAFWAVVGAEGR
jgi:uncharacterized LabA/DUF88 family protein